MEWFSHFLFGEATGESLPRRRWTTSLQESASLSIIPWSLGHSRLYTSKERRTAMQMLCPEYPQSFQGGRGRYKHHHGQ